MKINNGRRNVCIVYNLNLHWYLSQIIYSLYLFIYHIRFIYFIVFKIYSILMWHLIYKPIINEKLLPTSILAFLKDSLRYNLIRKRTTTIAINKSHQFLFPSFFYFSILRFWQKGASYIKTIFQLGNGLREQIIKYGRWS